MTSIAADRPSAASKPVHPINRYNIVPNGMNSQTLFMISCLSHASLKNFLYDHRNAAPPVVPVTFLFMRVIKRMKNRVIVKLMMKKREKKKMMKMIKKIKIQKIRLIILD